MKDLSNILIWKQNLGLLPIHLKPEKNISEYVMLNGGYGDFCLQTVKDGSTIDDYYSKAWSSNTKNFLVLENDKIKIFNWLKSNPEIVSQELVISNLDKFYNYLLTKSYKSSKDVVPHIIDIFRQFRNLTFEKTNPVEALNLLFILLTSLEENTNDLDFSKWKLKDTRVPKGFEYYVQLIREGIANIKPELDLIIRHSAGALFQEAQKEVLFFNPQKDLFGGSSNELKTKTNLYSSIHYTPAYLSRTIVENAIKNIDINQARLKIFDPACGASEFLIESLKQLKELNFKGDVEVIGWDSSETAVNTSNFLLKYEQRTIWKDRLKFNVKLVKDSLQENWSNDYNLIFMNPPFVSWELLNNKDSRDIVREVLGKNFAGKPNQASAFFYKVVQHLDENGVVGCVIPSSLLTLDSYKKLRDEIYSLISIKLLGKLGNFVFEDALADVSMVIAQKPKTKEIPTILWTRNEKGIAQDALRDLRKMIHSNELTIDNNDYSIFKPITFPIISESWKSISYKQNEFLKTIQRFHLEGKLVKVKDIFNVKQGINSGNNKLFKISHDKFLTLNIEEKKFFRPVLDNSAINRGQLFSFNYVWYPYGIDGIEIKTEKQFNSEAPQFYADLYPFKRELSKRARKNESNWWYLSEHRSWLLKKEPRLVSSRFGNSNSFAFDEKGDFIVENGNAWLPKKEFETSDYYFYLSIFSSSVFDKLLSIYSKQLSGGKWYDLGRKYSQEILIPNVNSTEVKNSDAYFKLVEIGRELTKGNDYAKSILDEVLNKYFYPTI